MIQAVRGRLWLIVALLLTTSLLAGCVLTPQAATIAVAPLHRVERHRLTRTVDLHAPEALPSELAAASTAPAAAPSPWARFDAALEGPTFAVARAREAVPVSVVAGGPAVMTLSPHTAIGAPRVLLVAADAGEWLQVLLPLRPNASTGWIRRNDVDVTTISQRVEIDRAAHRLRVFDAGALVIDEPVAIGRPDTPTPSGQFFVTELLRAPNPNGAYGPFAFTLSAYSPVYQRFGSGDGAIGIHGTNAPRLLGTDASHGCVRVSNEVIRRLATLLPLGTPVTIR